MVERAGPEVCLPLGVPGSAHLLGQVHLSHSILSVLQSPPESNMAPFLFRHGMCHNVIYPCNLIVILDNVAKEQSVEDLHNSGNLEVCLIQESRGEESIFQTVCSYSEKSFSLCLSTTPML